ncbi:hypothetical protein [Streptosporangium sp. NPDC003464]
MANWFRRGTPGSGRIRLLRTAIGRLRHRGAERIAGAPATGRVVAGLHRAAAGLAEVASEVSAYAGLLEEKAGELHARTRARRDPTGPG